RFKSSLAHHIHSTYSTRIAAATRVGVSPQLARTPNGKILPHTGNRAARLGGFASAGACASQRRPDRDPDRDRRAPVAPRSLFWKVSGSALGLAAGGSTVPASAMPAGSSCRQDL